MYVVGSDLHSKTYMPIFFITVAVVSIIEAFRLLQLQDTLIGPSTMLFLVAGPLLLLSLKINDVQSESPLYYIKVFLLCTICLLTAKYISIGLCLLLILLIFNKISSGQIDTKNQLILFGILYSIVLVVRYYNSNILL